MVTYSQLYLKYVNIFMWYVPLFEILILFQMKTFFAQIRNFSFYFFWLVICHEYKYMEANMCCWSGKFNYIYLKILWETNVHRRRKYPLICKNLKNICYLHCSCCVLLIFFCVCPHSLKNSPKYINKMSFNSNIYMSPQ